jgi:NAD(P)-dependent dehydrogenase (short-subunit alcohol dehydrogenase family)
LRGMTYDSNFEHTPTAIVTGASRGFGAAVARLLADDGWRLVVDARDPDRLADTVAELGPRCVGIAGDVTDADHRRALIDAAAATGGLDLLVNNASELGPSPLRPITQLDVETFARILAVNVTAPVALVASALPMLAARRGAVVDVTSDAAVEGYAGWGGYGASKAALEQVDRVLVAELADGDTDVRVWTLDPGDMRTDMHQAAFPGEDISDRADPRSVAPVVPRLVASRPPSGRIRAADVLVVSS